MTDIIKVLIPIVGVHVVVLAILIVTIKKLLLNDTLQAVKRIQAVEAEVRKKEESIRRDIQEHEKGFAKQKIEAEEEVQRHKAQTERELSRLRDQMLSDAKKESDRIVEQAHKNEEKLRQKIAIEMEQKSVKSAAEIFKLVFSDRLGGELDRQFTDELLDALNEIDGETITVDANEGEIKTSHPMPNEQKRRLEEILSAKFHRPIRVSETTDAALLAGLVLKIGSLEIDGSLRNRFEEAVGEISKSTTG